AARWPASSLTFFLEAIAARKLEAAGAPSLSETRLRWLFAPYRTVTRRLFETSATVITFDTEGMLSGELTATDGGLLPTAVFRHLQLSRLQPDAERLAAAVGAWDVALVDGETQNWLARRALELDAPVGA